MDNYGTYYTHYANHWHDSYETVDVVKQVSPILSKWRGGSHGCHPDRARTAQLRTVSPSGNAHCLSAATPSRPP